ncbi:MAG: cellulase family glycosylhydrolase [Actinomycetota bacterium]|nr:cellulase family glycosylhydrolase [Actinomycetota bacterium]
MRLPRTAMIGLALAVAAIAVPPPAQADAEPIPRIRACGEMLCAGPAPWAMRAASIYHSLASPGPAIDMAIAAGANTIRITDFLTDGLPADVAIHDEGTWALVDSAIAETAQHGLHVNLDLSSYRNLLAAQGMNPYTHDWTQFLTIVATRINSVTGRAYRDDPAIALVSIAGEPAAPNGEPGPGVPTRRQLTAFYARALATWQALAPDTLATAGGLSHLDWDSGIDWARIYALPGNDVCAVHVYGHRSLRKAITPMADYCSRLGKPWIMQETGVPQRIGDAARAAWLTTVLRRSWRNGAAGVGVWNIGDETVAESAGTYDISPGTPLAWTALQRGFARGPQR